LAPPPPSTPFPYTTLFRSHLLAIAHAAGVPLNLDDFEAMRARVPVLCDLKPSGKFVTVDLHRAGGVPQVMKILLAHGGLHGDARSEEHTSELQSLAYLVCR